MAEELKKEEENGDSDFGEAMDTRWNDVEATIGFQTRMALKALEEFISKQDNKSLFPEVDHSLHLMVTYKKPAKKNPGMLRRKIVLPHPFLTPTNATMCLILADLDRSDKIRHDPDVDKQTRQWIDILKRDHSIARNTVAKVLTKRQLEREYHTFKEKRELASAYDLFLVDSRVEKSVKTHLGKEFHTAHKMPVRVYLDGRLPLQKQMEDAYAVVHIPLVAGQTRISLKLGHLGQSRDHLCGNATILVKQLFRFCPGGVANIRSMHIQLANSSPSLPIYVDQDSANEVILSSTGAKGNKKMKVKVKESRDDLSTLPDGLSLAVKGNGRVRVLDQAGRSVIYPTVLDEWEDRDDMKPNMDLDKLAENRKRHLQRKRKDTKKRLNNKKKTAIPKRLKNKKK